MGKAICAMGESGSGKTTAMRNLDPKTTYYIDCDRKGLSWRGWRQQYSRENKNYADSNDPAKIEKLIRDLSSARPDIKTIVVDTINGIMVGDEMRRAKEKGYDKWVELSQCIWDLIDGVSSLRDDLTVIFVAHVQVERDDNGYMFTRILTSGKKLEKIKLESKFTTVLLAKCVDGKYLFETQAKNSTAKSPMGAFESFEIDNDIVQVLKALEEF